MTTSDLHFNSTIEPTIDIGAMWKAAIDRYETITKVKIESLSGAHNIDQILAEIEKRQAKFDRYRHDGSKLDKFRTLVKNSLAPIQVLGDIVSQATKTIYPPTEAIFVAVRYLVNVANTVSAGYDKVTAFFEDLGSYLNQLKTLGPNIPPIPELKVVITEVLTSVLVLCGICAKYLRMKRIVIVFRSLASGEDDELKAAYDHFHKMVRREQGIVRNVIVSGVEQLKLDVDAAHADVKGGLAVTQRIGYDTKILLADAGKIYKSIEGKENSSERDSILNWLSSLDFHEKQKATFAKHQEGTGQWLLNANEFQQWFLGGQNSTLWCPGIRRCVPIDFMLIHLLIYENEAGAGKTVMTSVAVNYIEENTQRSKVAIAYVYCDYKDPKTQSEIQLLSSIIRQLAEQSKPLPPEVNAFRDKYAEKRRHPTADERISLMRTISEHFERTYVFVDALDECAETNRERFLRLTKSIEHFVSLFITSRPHLHLEKKFTNMSRLDIVARGSDIQTYLESEIDRNDRLCELIAQDPNLKVDIIKRLNDKASGMFLLSHLQILHLCRKSSVTQVRTSLDLLPAEVYDFYEEAIARIEDQSKNDRRTAKRALSYISCARRPLNLEELRHALSVEAGYTKLDKDNFPVTNILFTISAGLIRVDEKSSTTTLVHYTLQEYLENYPNKLLPEPEIDFAAACLTYLSFDDFRNGPCADGEALERRLRDYRFLDYASHYWGHHVISDQLHERMGSLLGFLKDEAKVSSFVQILNIPRYRMKGWYDRFPKQFSPLHVVAYWGLDKIFNILFQEETNINRQDSYGATALKIAAQHGHTTVVRLLVENGAKVNITTNRGETALCWAARNGHTTIVELLIANGANIMTEDHEGWTALDWAVIGGYTEAAKVLLDHSFYYDSKSDGRNKALLLAAEAGNEKSVQMLLSTGAEVDWKDDTGSTALTWAVPEGREETVQMLLKNGADVNSRDHYDNTPLHWALPYETIARILLDNKANINAKNNHGQTPLLWSAQDGQVEVLQLLVECKADVNAQDRYGFTALHAAALKGYEAMARLLLENGADPNVKDDDGWTPLHAAALRQHEGILHLLLNKVQNGAQMLTWVASRREDPKKRALLEHMTQRKSRGSTATTGLRWVVGRGRSERVEAILENGADINAEDVGGWTALTMGAFMGQEATVQLLLENGADINKRERGGQSALHLASKDGYHDIVQLLVEHGAKIDTDVFGFTAMLLAARQGHTEIMQYLVQKGADVNAEDYHGRRALHWAAKHGPPMIVQILTDKGADLNAVDRWGRTALMWAVENRQSAIVDLLLEIRADVEIRAEDGSTALHLAAYFGSKEALYQLLEGGANLKVRSRDGFTALHIAAFLGYVEVVQLLLERGGEAEAQTQWSGEKDEALENGEEAESNADGWPDECDADDWQDDEDDVDGGFGSVKAYWRAPSLSKRLRHLLLEQEIAIDVKAEAQNSLTVEQLAASGGSLAVQRLLRQHQQPWWAKESTAAVTAGLWERY
ncbi:hypothetical protein MMC18_007530 [Xylographa bjoerkii]|nr:hypothetical protein [Xylographa bjoerkii]